VVRQPAPDPAETRAVAVPAATAREDWPQTGGSAEHSGGHIAGNASLAYAWRADIGSGAGYRQRLIAGPVVSGGRIFVSDSEAQVVALDLASGSRAWRRDTRREDDGYAYLGAGVAVAGQRVLVGTGLGEALALDAGSGEILWRKDLPGPARGAPAVDQGRVFIPLLDNQLAALSIENGDTLWTHRGIAGGTGVVGAPAPAVDAGIVVAGFASGELVGIRAESGRVAWTDALGGTRGRESLSDLAAIRGAPAISAGRIFAASLGGLIASLEVRAGRRIWEREASGAEMPWPAGDWVFVVSADQVVAALSRDTGAVRWTRELPAFGNPDRRRDPIGWTGPLLLGGVLWLAGTTGELVGIAPETGEIASRQRIGPGAVGPMAAANGTLLVLGDNGTITAFR
jgi:outer membrane protein assembly factor BamB